MKVKEPAREGFLQQLWLDRIGRFTHLRSLDGRTIQILEKGKRNYDTGPDFLNALVTIEGHMLRGDIEVDPVASDWYAHGHDKNPRYNDVIVHIVTMHCPENAWTVRQDGQTVAVVNLDDFLEKPAEELEKENGVAPTVLVPVDCALSRMEQAVVLQILDRAAEVRLANKTAYFSESRLSASWNQIFYQSILEGLGYSKNQIAFRNLAQTMPVELLWNYLWKDPRDLAVLKCEAFLFGGAGLLQPPPLDDETRVYIDRLQKIWHHYPIRQKITILKPGLWQFFRLRPHNFPTRRIAAAAVLVVRYMNRGFVDSFVRVLQNGDPVRKSMAEMEKCLLVKSHGFWQRHFCFADTANEPYPWSENHFLLGSNRSRDIFLNVLIPGLLAFAGETGDGRLVSTLKLLYGLFPALEENELTRAMRIQLKLKHSGRMVTAHHQQGMIHLKKLLCLGAACRRCLEPGALSA